MHSIINSTGSLFLNNKTQAVRLKRDVAFADNPKHLVAYRLFDGESQILTLVKEEDALDYLSYINKKHNISQEEMEKDSKRVSVFFNNTTQSVRIPVSLRFDENVTHVSVTSTVFGDNKKFLTLQAM